MNDATSEFAKLLVQYMAGLDDETLAEQIGTSQMTIYNWRTGKIKQPRHNKVIKCAEVFKLTPKQRLEFLTAAGYPPKNYEPPHPPVPVVGHPIIQPYQFFGREKVLHKIYSAWNKPVPESIIITGPKRSGKTSLLHYLNHITQAIHLRPDQPKGWPNWLPHGFQFAFVDFRESNMHHPETLVTDVLQQLKLKVPNSCNISALSTLIKQQINQPRVILMDDIEAGLAAPALDADFWWNMRSLGSHGKLSFVVMATALPVQLARDNNKPSPFFNIFGHSLQLEAFTKDEARELLANSLKPFSPEEIEEMLKDSECWPETLQKLCDARLQK